MRLFRPTLTRRVVYALLLAFLLTGIVLLTFQYMEVRLGERQNPALTNACAQLQDALRNVAEATQAHSIAAAVDRMSTGGRARQHVPDSLLIQVWDRRDQKAVYSSPRLRTEILSGDVRHQTRQVVQGQLFEVARLDTPAWSVRVAQTHVDAGWLLKTLAVELIKYMLIALPFVLLPVWLAASRALRPLRVLSERIAARSSDDLSRIGIEPKHAELVPIVASLDGLLAKLAVKMGRERAFVQDAAHELRTPLAVISAQAHALKHSTDVAGREEAGQYLDAAIARASHLTHQLLALARLDVDRPCDHSVVDLAQLVRRDLAGFAEAARARQIDLSLEGPDRLVVSIDVLAFQSVLHNLVDNAIRYGRDRGRIQVDLESKDGSWRLAVLDDGPGIAAAERALVFDRFYRGSGHDTPGTGLGLAIVAQATRRLGAEITLTEGLDGGGCQFSVTVKADSVIQ